MKLTKAIRTRPPWLDLLLLTTILVGLNFAIDPTDIGWTSKNPSPYLLLPVLLGGRYGTFSGLAGAIVGIAVVLVGGGAWENDSMLMGGLLMAGFICGEVQGYFARRLSYIETRESHASARLRDLGLEVSRLRAAKDQLDKQVATRNSETTTIDSEIRLLGSHPPDELQHHFLLLLQRVARVSDASFYEPCDKGAWRRITTIGNVELFPKTVDVEAVELIRMALERRTAAALPELRNSMPPPEKSYLIAAPFFGIEGKPVALLLVAGMPFMAFNPGNFQLISNVCRWTANTMEARLTKGAFRLAAGGADGRVYVESFFQRTWQITWEMHRDHQLPATFVLFYLLDGGPEDQAALEANLLSHVRSGDFPAVVALPFPHILVLLPLTGERGACLFVERCKEALSRNEFTNSNDLRILHVPIDALEVNASYKDVLEYLRQEALGPLHDSLV